MFVNNELLMFSNDIIDCVETRRVEFYTQVLRKNATITASGFSNT